MVSIRWKCVLLAKVVVFGQFGVFALNEINLKIQEREKKFQFFAFITKSLDNVHIV
jgi:hypothetical protein